MSKQSQTGETFDSGALDLIMPLNFSAVREMNQSTIDSVGEMNQVLYEGLSRYNEEFLTFVNGRLKEDFAAPQHLMTCTTPQEVYDLYMQFFQTAVKQYLTEAERLTSLGSNVAGATLQAMEHQITEHQVTDNLAADTREATSATAGGKKTVKTKTS